VQLVTEQGMPAGKVARELDVHPKLLHTWRRRLLKEGEKAFVRKGHARPEGAEKNHFHSLGYKAYPDSDYHTVFGL